MAGAGRDRIIAWAIHGLTASGAVVSLLALLAVIEGDARAALLWLALALALDGLDGPLARRFEVRRHLPRFDGAILDLVVDYLGYVVVPALFLHRFGHFPDGWSVAATAFILATSLYIFANLDMKTEDNYFVGFPAIWNVVALVVHVLDPPKAVTLAATLVLGLASFSTVKFVHPLRVREGRGATIAATFVWGATSIALILLHPDRPATILAAWLVASAWILGRSARRTLHVPRRSSPAE